MIDFFVSPFPFVVRPPLPSSLFRFGVSLSVVPPLCLSCPVFLAFPFPLLLTPRPQTGPGCQGSLSSAPSPPLFRFLLCPRVLCLVFLAADWSGFPAPPSSPPFPLFCTSLIPDLFSRQDLRLSVIFLAADWSGVSHCWLPSQTIPSSNSDTFSGHRLVRGVAAHHTSWYSSQDNKQSSHGLNLTLMRSSMICWMR